MQLSAMELVDSNDRKLIRMHLRDGMNMCRRVLSDIGEPSDREFTAIYQIAVRLGMPNFDTDQKEVCEWLAQRYHALERDIHFLEAIRRSDGVSFPYETLLASLRLLVIMMALFVSRTVYAC